MYRPISRAAAAQWRAVAAIVRKDILVWLRTPAAIVVCLAPPLALLLVGFLAGAAVGRNPVALVVADPGPQAARLTAVLEASDAFRLQRADAAGAAVLLRNLDVAGVITIPADFDRRYAAHEPDPVVIQINNLNLDFTNDLRRALPAAITDFYADQNPDPVTVRVAETDLRTTDVTIEQFMVLPNLVLLVSIAGVLNTGLAMSREFEDLTMKELLLAPASRASLMTGKLLAGWVTTMLLSCVVLGIAAVTGVLRPAGIGWVIAIGVMAVYAVAAAGIGAAVGAMIHRFMPTALVGICVAIYLFFLSGGIAVAAFLPAWIRTMAHLVPTYYAVHAMEGAIFYHSSQDLGRDLVVLGATAVGAIVLGIVALQRSVRR
jgi:ABC-type multidrug transport system permease subunit